jgi:hypothetical protein
MPRPYLPGLLFSAFLCYASAAAAQDLYSILKPKLEGGQLELRTPAPEVQLTFDDAGTLKRPSSHGLRSIDAFLLVKKIKVEGSVFSLEGERLAMIWNQKKQRTELSHTSLPVYVAMELPIGHSTDEKEFAKEFYKVFVSPEESKHRECSVEEQKMFAEAISKTYPRKKKDSEVEPATQVCFPGGNRVLKFGKGIKPPKAIKTEDPHYSGNARQSKIQGTNVFMVAIDDTGQTTDALMVRSLEPSLNYESLVALRNWTFKAAELDGKPVACTVNVEINYRLY